MAERNELPLEVFFARYPLFNYNSTRSASFEFGRLCNESGWPRNERKKAHRKFKNALIKQFNRIYGTDKDSLANWQNLCYVVRVDPIPDDLKSCRKAVRKTYVNIVDLVDTTTTGEDVKIFDSELALSQYTKATRKIFPRDEAKAGGLLRYLLRQIAHPRMGGSSRR